MKHHRLKFILKLSVCASIAMYLTNKWVESSALIHKILKKDIGKYYNWRNGKIFYTKSGSGSPVLLIHDLHPTSSRQEWANVIRKLSETNTVYAVDLLGCGRSDKPNLTYTNYLYVQMIGDFVQEVIGEKTDIIASGKSASFAVMAAKMYPDCLGKLTLVSPESLGKLSVMPSDCSKLLKMVLNCPLLGVFIYYLLTSRSQIEYNFTETYFYNPFRLNDTLTYTYYESAHMLGGAGRHLLASMYGCYVNFDIRFALSGLQNEILLVFGRETDYAQEIAKSYQKENPAVVCRFVDKTKMLPHLEAPEAFLNVL